MRPFRAAFRRPYRVALAALIRYRTVVLEGFIAFQTAAVGAWILGVLVLALVIRAPLAYLMYGVLGAALAGTGALNLGALLVGRPGVTRSQKNLDVCRRCMFVAALLWALLTIMSGIARPFGLYWPTFLGHVAGALWCYYRLNLRFTPEE